jgi:hypothetical protein
MTGVVPEMIDQKLQMPGYTSTSFIYVIPDCRPTHQEKTVFGGIINSPFWKYFYIDADSRKITKKISVQTMNKH